MRTLKAVILALALTAVAGVAQAASVTGIADGLDELELFKTPDAPDSADTLSAGEARFPIPILEVSEAMGMVKINVKGADYWVQEGDALTDRGRSVDTGCEPKMAGTVVVHGKRGVGENCQ